MAQPRRAPLPADEPHTDDRVLPIRFGCSSFSSDDWVGPFYPEGTAPRDYLRVYAQHFDTVEVDATYYAVPRASIVDGWVDKTPDGFLLSAKFPRSICHAGEAAVPDGKKVLTPATYAERDEFLEVMARMGDRLGPLVLQFPYFSKAVFKDERTFFDRLNTFLEELPAEFEYAVEVRNRTWMGPDLAHLLRRHRVTMVLVDQAWMPHADEVQQQFDPVTGPRLYVRLLGDRKEIEAITRTWDTEVIDRRERLRRWSTFLTKTIRNGPAALVYVNNHYAGHAPTTVRRLMEMVEAEMNDRNA